MGTYELLLIAVGLSMDAFAVAVCKGLNMNRINYRHSTVIALFFGGFQGLMPLVGWMLGRGLQSYIETYDHWIAFFLLVCIGGKMIYEALHPEESRESDGDTLDIKELFLLSIATSIDALAVGITFAVLPDTNILLSVSLIAVITFALSFLGVVIGNKFGSRFEGKAELAGGAILILIGTKILLEHLGMISL